MADKYIKVRNNAEKAPDNEVRITKNKPFLNYKDGEGDDLVATIR